MNSVSSISASGMQAAQTQWGAAASNISNLNATNGSRLVVDQSAQPEGGVVAVVRVDVLPLETDGTETVDAVTELQAKNQFLANLAVFKTGDQMMGKVIDVQG